MDSEVHCRACGEPEPGPGGCCEICDQCSLCCDDETFEGDE